MLKELKFVQGAVAKRDFVPAMTHFRIENGFVRAYNGTLALCSPIDFDLDCTPRADKLVKAISNCNDEDGPPVLTMSSNGKLRLKSGRYTTFIDTVEGETPHVEPKGEVVQFDGELLLEAVRKLLPFIGDDAYRLWTNGLLLRGQSAFVTNNVTLVEYWLGTDVPFVVNIPKVALREMLRIGEPPTYAQLDKNSMTLHYEDRRWIRTQLLETAWPDLSRVLDVSNNPKPIDKELFVGIEKLSSDADAEGRVYIKGGRMSTVPLAPPGVEEEVAETGAHYEIQDQELTGVYQIKMLNLLAPVATHADFSRYPEPALFFGERLRGAVIGMRM